MIDLLLSNIFDYMVIKFNYPIYIHIAVIYLISNLYACMFKTNMEINFCIWLTSISLSVFIKQNKYDYENTGIQSISYSVSALCLEHVLTASTSSLKRFCCSPWMEQWYYPLPSLLDTVQHWKIFHCVPAIDTSM